MRTKQTVFAIVLLIALLLIINVSAQEEEVVIAPQPCDEPGSLTLWVWDPTWAELLGELVDVWTTNYCPGAEVEIIQQPYDAYWAALPTAAIGGEMPDVFNMAQDMVGFYANNEVLLDLQPYFDEYGVDTTVWGSGETGPYVFDGDLYAAPLEWVTVTIFYNKDLFDAAGVDYPTAEWTWDDFAAAAEALTDPEAGVYGASVYAGYQTGYTNWIAATGEDPVVTPDRSACTLTSEDSIAALTFLKDLYDAGYMPSVSDMGGSGADDAFNMFVSGQVAMITAGSWRLPNAVEQVEFNWDIVQLPRHPETDRSRSNVHSTSYAASAASENPDLAANLILFLVSDEAQLVFAEGGGVAPSNPNPEIQAVWADSFTEAGVNVQAFVDATNDSWGVTAFAEIWNYVDAEIVVNIFDLDMSLEEATTTACEFIDEQIAVLANP